MAKIKETYFDNFNYNEDEFKYYFMKDNEIEDEKDVDMNALYDYIAEELDFQWRTLIEQINFSEYSDTPCVVVGSVKRWCGSGTICPEVFSDIESAINKCVSNMDYVTIRQVNGHLSVVTHDHDGGRTLEIHLLNDRGLKAMERIEEGYGVADLGNRTYHKAIKGFLI